MKNQEGLDQERSIVYKGPMDFWSLALLSIFVYTLLKLVTFKRFWFLMLLVILWLLTRQ